jgi:hypothetical protein
LAEKSRKLVLLAPPSENGASCALGTKRELLRSLLPFNTAQDGSTEGFSMIWGPGIRIDLPFVDEKDTISQVMVTVLEEDYAWPVLTRLCRELGWVMMDPDSGRTFGA